MLVGLAEQVLNALPVVRMHHGEIGRVVVDLGARVADDRLDVLGPDRAVAAFLDLMPGGNLRLPLGLDQEGPVVGELAVRLGKLRHFEGGAQDIADRTILPP